MAPVAATKASAGIVANNVVGTSKISTEALTLRVTSIDDAVKLWRSATDLRAAHAAAEEARNLIVGAHGPFYGDGDRDGSINGSSDNGLLPGRAGEEGIAKPTDGPCVTRDILGGSWKKPAQRWSILEAVIKAWTPFNNTMPTLPSHPQRIVGWATLALATNELADVREYGGHAQIHSDVSKAAVKVC